MDLNSVPNNPQSNNLIQTEAEEEIKHEILDLCRICETEENLIDISQTSFQHLNKQLHEIANVEEKYDYCLKYICAQCSMKLENAFHFKTQCEFTYKKLIDQLEGKDFANILSKKSSDDTFNKDTILIPPSCKIQSEDNMRDTVYLTNVLNNVNCKEHVKSLSTKLKKDNKIKIVVVTKSSSMTNNEDLVPEITDYGVDFIATLPTDGNTNVNSSSDHTKESEVESWDKKYRKYRLWDHSYVKPIKPSEFGMTVKSEKTPIKFEILFGDTINNQIQKDLRGERKTKLKKQKKEPTILTCEICEKTFCKKHKLKEHMDCVHLKIKNHMCSVCGQNFVYRTVLNNHIKSKHTVSETPRFYECDICGKKLKSNSLKSHKETHLGPNRVMKYKNLICDICGASFKNSCNFKYHMNKHNGIKPYKCDICGKCFLRSDVLKSHINNHHKSNKTTSFACQYCAQKFESRGTLLKHFWWNHKKTNDYNSINNSTINTGAKLYRCTECPIIFKSITSLNNHKNIHAGTTPYKCLLCPKTFTSKNFLKIHMVSHTGERNYKCSNCPKTYRYNKDYYAHIKTCLSNE